MKPRGGVSGWELVTAGLLLTLTAVPAPAAAAVESGPVPDWVRPVEPELGASSSEVDVSEGIHHLLLDVQVNGLVRPVAEYTHRAWRVLGGIGVQNGSSLRIPFDPSYQRLVLHEVVIHRDGERLPRLDVESLRLIQREERLDAQIYDGTLTALYFVEGVHDGDVVEHSFTLTGLNPTFEDRWAENVDVQWSVPLARHEHRLLWPAGRELKHRSHGSEIRPTIRPLGAAQELTWSQTNVAPRIVESDIPDWYQAWAWVQLSEWSSWEEVADWGRRLFEPTEALPEALRDRALVWLAEGVGEAELARRALRLVQDEVRYLGIEFGPKAYQPSEPRAVYERRFGDCKDKSVLLVELLRALGLEAAPALVDTVSGRLLPQILPTPLAFDHAVVRLRLDGTDHWLDSTRIHERGPIGKLSVPDWTWALVLEPETRELSPVDARDFGLTRIEESYEAPDYDSPVLFTVRTRHEGSDADAIRAHLAGSSREEIQLTFRDYYAKLWARIELARPLAVDDDEAENILVTTETYRILDFWRPSPDGRSREAELWSLVLDDELVVPASVARDRPIGLVHPWKLEQRTQVNLPEPWAIDPRQVSIRDPAFRFDHEARAHPDGRVVLEHRYVTLRDSVEPERAVAYRDAVERARSTLGLSLVSQSARGRASTRDLEWPLVLLVALSLVVAVATSLRVHRHLRAREGGEVARRFGGWLLVFTPLVLLAPVGGLLRLGGALPSLARGHWRALTGPEGGDAFAEAEVLCDLLGGALLVGLGLLAAAQWLARRRRAPSLLAGYLVASYLLFLLDALLVVGRTLDAGVALEQAGRLLVGMLLLGALLAYLAISERVAGTFLR